MTYPNGQIDIKPYTHGDNSIWDQFIDLAKNGHFMFKRDYMEYHQERFQDYSLMFYDDKNHLIALLPANLSKNILHSHQWLTFGGFIIDEKMTCEVMLNIFESLRRYLHDRGIKKFIYKCIPYIYHKNPAEEDKYALFVNNAKLIRRDVTSTIFMDAKIKYNTLRNRSIKKAIKANVIFEQSSDFAAYWYVLSDVLSRRHEVKPVHTAEEIQKLANRFPNNIKLFVAKMHDEVLAGAVVYENENIIHTQYLANSLAGRNLGALDLVIDTLIRDVYNNKRYIDFGKSNEKEGRYLNTGLISQKEGFGARSVVHDFYEWQI